MRLACLSLGFRWPRPSLSLCPSLCPSGKSTTTGRLIFELGGIPERELEKLKAEADALGKSSFAFAFYMDTQKEERARGVTISCTTKEFFTEKWHYTIIDAPGEDRNSPKLSQILLSQILLFTIPPSSSPAASDPSSHLRLSLPLRPQGFHQEHDFRRRPGRRLPADGPRRR